MEYVLGALCLTILILGLLGKPIRIEIIHSIAAPPEPKVVEVEAKTPQEEAYTKTVEEQAADIMAFVNQHFHNVDTSDNGGHVNG